MTGDTSSPVSENDEESAKKVGRKISSLVPLSKNLKNLYLDDKEKDVARRVQKPWQPAERYSQLTAMFSHNMLERCDPKAFDVFLLFLYSGTTDKLGAENVQSVYYIADKYDIPHLKNECCHCVLSTLTVYSVSHVIALALRHQEKELLQKATEFSLNIPEAIFPTIEWQMFMKENTTAANELVIRAVKFHAQNS